MNIKILWVALFISLSNIDLIANQNNFDAAFLELSGMFDQLNTYTVNCTPTNRTSSFSMQLPPVESSNPSADSHALMSKFRQMHLPALDSKKTNFWLSLNNNMYILGENSRPQIRAFGNLNEQYPNYITLDKDFDASNAKETVILKTENRNKRINTYPNTRLTTLIYPNGVRTLGSNDALLFINGIGYMFDRGHLVDDAHTLQQLSGILSTRDPFNFVPQHFVYNRWIRSNITKRCKAQGDTYKEIAIFSDRLRQDDNGNAIAEKIPEGFLFVTYDQTGQVKDRYYFPNFFDYQHSKGCAGRYINLFKLDSVPLEETPVLDQNALNTSTDRQLFISNIVSHVQHLANFNVQAKVQDIMQRGRITDQRQQSILESAYQDLINTITHRQLNPILNVEYIEHLGLMDELERHYIKSLELKAEIYNIFNGVSSNNITDLQLLMNQYDAETAILDQLTFDWKRTFPIPAASVIMPVQTVNQSAPMVQPAVVIPVTQPIVAQSSSPIVVPVAQRAAPVTQAVVPTRNIIFTSMDPRFPSFMINTHLNRWNTFQRELKSRNINKHGMSVSSIYKLYR